MLTGRFRHAALLVPSKDGRAVTDAYLTWSTHQPPQRVRDPYQILDRRGEGDFQPREADGARALWRDLDSLLLKDSRQDARRPPVLEHLPKWLLPRLRVRAYGFDQDGQQKDSVWFRATTPAVLRWQEENDAEMAYHVKCCHTAAEKTGDRLEFAARIAWKIATDTSVDLSSKAKIKLDARKPGPWASAALSRYWPTAEKEFWQLTAPGHAMDRVDSSFVDAALAALDEAIGQANRADIRVARARHRARGLLLALLQPPTSD
jgi:CRISPR system Cascade subunit CasA